MTASWALTFYIFEMLGLCHYSQYQPGTACDAALKNIASEVKNTPRISDGFKFFFAHGQAHLA
jgi:hypothetical protein